MRAALAQQFHHAQRAIATHGIEGEGGVRPAKRFLGGGHADIVVEKHFIGSQIAELLDDFAAAHEGNRMDSQIARELDHAAADRGVAEVLDDPVAAVQSLEAVQQSPGGRRVYLEHGGLHGVDARRQPEQDVGRNGGVRGPRRGATEEHDVVSRFEIVRGAGFHDSASFHAGDCGKIQFHAVGAFDGIQVRRIDRSCRDADQDFSRFRCLRRKRIQFKHLTGFPRLPKPQLPAVGIHAESVAVRFRAPSRNPCSGSHAQANKEASTAWRRREGNLGV